MTKIGRWEEKNTTFNIPIPKSIQTRYHFLIYRTTIIQDTSLSHSPVPFPKAQDPKKAMHTRTLSSKIWGIINEFSLSPMTTNLRYRKRDRPISERRIRTLPDKGTWEGIEDRFEGVCFWLGNYGTGVPGLINMH